MASLACAEINNVLQAYYPDLVLREFLSGQYGVYQREYRWSRYDVTHLLGYSEDFDDQTLIFPEVGYSCLFSVRNRLLGFWVMDEVKRRDPRYANNPGNVFYQDRLATAEADVRKEREREFARQSALDQWNIVRKNEATMEAVGRALEKGDTEAAAKELSIEGAYKRAKAESPHELKDPKYWQNF